MTKTLTLMPLLSFVWAVVMAAATPALSAPPSTGEAPGRERLLVLDVTGDGSPSVRGLAQRAVTEELTNLGTYDVLSTRDIQSMLDTEAEKQAAGCDGNSSCLAEVAGALGAAVVVAGETTAIGSGFMVQLTLLEPRAARVLARGSAKASVEEDIPDAARLAARSMMNPHESAAWPLPTLVSGAVGVVVGGALVGVGLLPLVAANNARANADVLVDDNADATAFAANHAEYDAAAANWTSWGAPLVAVGVVVVVVGGAAAIAGGIGIGTE
jgi:hypothetical protein